MKKGWEYKKLGDVCRLVRGPFGGSLKKTIFVGDGIAVYEQQHAIYNDFQKVRYFISEEKFREMVRFEVQPHDLIMSCSGTMGKVAIVPAGIRRGIINQALLKLTPLADLSSVFLKYWMDSYDFQERLLEQSGGAAIQNVASISVLKEILIPVPPLPEQQRIVSVLDEAFAGLANAQANAEKNLQNARALFDSHLQAIFTQRGDGWVETKLEAKIDLLAGFPFKSARYTNNDHDVRLLRGDNIVQGYVRWEDVKRWPVTDTGEYQRYWLASGDVVLAMDRPWVKAGLKRAQILINDLPCLLVQRTARLRGDASMNNRFLFYLISSERFINHIVGIQTGIGVPHISGQQIKDFQFQMPPLHEQIEIASNLDALSAETQRLARIYEQKKAALVELKKALLHQAFSGEL
ncbi:MAG TPA: restriction endonuclease subunit S [Pseudomonadota bacterium]|nr:restriction endonuclease subunit S [Pseudomonadota bacterium]